MKCEKPVTEHMRQKARKVYEYLKSNERFVDKQELCKVLECSNERTVRDVIAYIAMHYPIIANSTQSGYKLARRVSDEEEVRHTWAELSGRQEEIERRIKPLIRFCDKVNQIKGERRWLKSKTKITL